MAHQGRRAEMELTEAQLNELAIKVAAILDGNSVSRLIPMEIGEWIRGQVDYARRQINQLYLSTDAILQQSTINIDGTIIIELQNMNGQTFWAVTLKPADMQ